MTRLPMFLTALLASLPVLASAGAAAPAQDPVRHGRALVEEFCARCHAVGRTGRSPHADAPPLRSIGRSFDLDEFPRTLERGITSTHPDMPEFTFDADEVGAIIAYLKSIQER